MSFTRLTSGIHDLAAKFAGASPNRRALFLKKTSAGTEEKGEIVAGFLLKQEKTKEGEIIFFLRFPNSPKNLALVASDQHASTNVVLENYNPLYDGFIFDLDNNFDASGDLSYISRRVKITKNKYQS